jgi:hypothetical protein
MPDNNNRIVKQDLRAALGPAELRIVQFKPPAAGADPPPDPPNLNFRVSIPDIQQQVADKSAQERTDALFDFLVRFIAQGVNDELGRQQILQRLGNLERRIAALETGTARSGTL